MKVSLCAPAGRFENKLRNTTACFRNSSAFIFLTIFLSIFSTKSAFAQELAKDRELHLGGAVYGWGSSIGGNTANGAEIDISLSEVLDHLKMSGMGALGARMGDFWFVADGIYVDLEDHPSGLVTDIDLKSWIVNPFTAYTILELAEGRLDILAGARMLYLDAEVSGEGERIGAFNLSDSGTNWDAVGGVKGKINLLAENFYLPFHFDMGGGDSDLTWQILGGLGYQFEKISLIAGYRYLDFEFKSNAAIDNLNVKGPFVGVSFLFF